MIVAELRIMRQGHDPGQQIERICKEALEFDMVKHLNPIRQLIEVLSLELVHKLPRKIP